VGGHRAEPLVALLRVLTHILADRGHHTRQFSHLYRIVAVSVMK
jgi:hypothetical protein